MAAVPFAELTEQQRTVAMRRWAVIAPHVQDEVPLTAAAADQDVALRTAQRWLAAYRTDGLAGLAPPRRSDHGSRRFPVELVELIEGLALQRPRQAQTTIWHRACRVADDQGWPAPSYSAVRSIIGGLDPQLVTLAHDGPAVWRDRYELVWRRHADAPIAMWQADHTERGRQIQAAPSKLAISRPWSPAVPRRSACG